MTSPIAWSGYENTETDLPSLLAFADQNPRAYILAFFATANSLFHSGVQTIDRSALCCVLVYLHQHFIALKLKQLTLGAAKLLRKSLTLYNIRTIDSFSIAQLWPNLSLMLDQIEADRRSPRPPEWDDIELRLRLLGQYDADLRALRSLAGLPLEPRRQKKTHSRRKSTTLAPTGTQTEFVVMLEGLSESLLHIEQWIQNHLPQDPDAPH